MQKEFVSRGTRYLDSIKNDAGKSETEIKESPEYQQLEAEEKAARETVQPEIQEIDSKVASRSASSTRLPTHSKPARSSHRHQLQHRNHQGKAQESWRQEAEEKKAEEVTIDMPSDDGNSTKPEKFNYARLEALYDQLREEKRKGIGRKAELLKEPSEKAKKKDDYLRNHLIGLGPAAIESLKTKIANYDYSILGHQISVNAYNVVDRCEVCHAGIREPLELRPPVWRPVVQTTNLIHSRAFVSHPNKETSTA